MFKTYQTLFLCSLVAVLFSCSKKTQPTTNPVIESSSTTTKTATPIDTIAVAKKTDSFTVVTKSPVRKKPVDAVPKVISVNDAAAKKSVDGRLYYDLQGHRYWRNYKDGKYYLYNKSMNTDEAFKKPN